MLKTTFNYDDFYNIISSLLNSSFNISTTKIGKISELSNYLNLEFRKVIWSNEDTNNTMINGISEMKKNALCIVHSAMEFTTIEFSFSHEISNDTLFIGPFLENEPNDEFINYILKCICKLSVSAYFSKNIPHVMGVVYALFYYTWTFTSSHSWDFLLCFSNCFSGTAASGQ